MRCSPQSGHLNTWFLVGGWGDLGGVTCWRKYVTEAGFDIEKTHDVLSFLSLFPA